MPNKRFVWLFSCDLWAFHNYKITANLSLLSSLFIIINVPSQRSEHSLPLNHSCCLKLRNLTQRWPLITPKRVQEHWSDEQSGEIDRLDRETDRQIDRLCTARTSLGFLVQPHHQCSTLLWSSYIQGNISISVLGINDRVSKCYWFGNVM